MRQIDYKKRRKKKEELRIERESKQKEKRSKNQVQRENLKLLNYYWIYILRKDIQQMK